MWVAISMVLIIAIWIISLVAQNKQMNSADSLSKQQIMEQFQDQKKSLQDTTNQINDLQGQTQKSLDNSQKPSFNNNPGEGMTNQ
jgi:hypothetical protein